MTNIIIVDFQTSTDIRQICWILLIRK